MSYYTLRDCEKFKIMREVYSTIFGSSKAFSEKIGVGKATIFHWIQLEKKLNDKDAIYNTNEPIKCSFNTKSKVKICQGFGLIDTVWSDSFYQISDFEERLPDYKKIEKKPMVRIWTAEDRPQRDRSNLSELESLSTADTNALLEKKLENKSALFMFSFAEKLKKKERIEEALDVLTWIENGKDTFKYIQGNKITHLRAILLSHEKIKDWDGAIDILRSLYYSSAYHLEKPEILTLLASNYKRKALDSATSKEEIDINFLMSSLCLYEDSMNLKPDNQKYYDAINLAYLYKIVDAIEVEYANKVELTTLSKKVESIKNEKDWWEVSSKAEFSMLLGQIDDALLFINGFFENHIAQPSIYEVNDFKIGVLLRQLNLYIQFTEDINAIKLLKEVDESWKNI